MLLKSLELDEGETNWVDTNETISQTHREALENFAIWQI